MPTTLAASASQTIAVPTDGSQSSYVVEGFGAADSIVFAGYVPGTSDFAWAAGMAPDGSPDLELRIEEDGTDVSTTVDFAGVAPGDLSGLKARVGAAADGTSANLVISGAAQGGGDRTPLATNQEVLVGGLQDFAALDDPSNVAALLATGRAGLYMHQSDVFNAEIGWAIPGLPTASQLPGALQTFASEGGDAENELGFDPVNSQDQQARSYALNQQSGYTSAFANVNLDFQNGGGATFEPFSTLDGLAWWKTRVDEARAMGTLNLAPVLSPNGGDMVAVPWSSPTWDVARQEALYGGGIAIDAPPAFFLVGGPNNSVSNDAYQQFTEQEIAWGNSQGIRTTYIVSPYGDGSSFLAQSEQLVRQLVAANAVPSQWVVENYDAMVDPGYVNGVGNDEAPNSVSNVALWFAQNAPVTVDGHLVYPPGYVLAPTPFSDPTGLGTQINQLFDAFLGQDADPATLSAFVAVDQAGATLQQIAQGLTASPLYQQTLGSENSVQVVGSLYQSLFGRPADAVSAVFANMLNSGTSVATLAVEMASLPEAQYHAGTRQAAEIGSLFKGILNENVDTGTGAAFMGLLSHGITVTDIATALLASPDYAQKGYGATSGSAIANLYQNSFGTQPDPAGAAGWAANLGGGMSLATAAVDIVSTPQALARSGFTGTLELHNG